LESSNNSKTNLSSKVQDEQDQKRKTALPISGTASRVAATIGGNSSKTRDNPESAKGTDEWAEVLRYLHLFTAMQAGNAWEGVREMVEQLRESSKTPPPLKVENVDPTGYPRNATLSAEAAALREAHRETSRQLGETQNELRILVQQSGSLQRETTQLREKLIRDREAQLVSQTKMENRSEGLTATLQADETKLEHAVREVEELRGHVLKQGGLEQWQVDRVEQLRRSLADAREATSQYSAQSRDLRTRLEIMSGGAKGDMSSSCIGPSESELNSLLAC
jgi:vacuolar-type H+-ATPase subunit I/STV1